MATELPAEVTWFDAAGLMAPVARLAVCLDDAMARHAFMTRLKSASPPD